MLTAKKGSLSLPGATTGIRERLLVVDDEELNRDMLSRRLERSGFSVEVARDGNEALRMVEEHGYDLVLLDQMMPGRSGSEVLEALRKRHSASELPVIMVTALTESGRVAEALDAGANDYVTKPIEFTITLARIRSQLSRKHADKARQRSEERYELAARAANDGLWDWDLITDEVYYSARWKQMLELSGELIASSPSEWFERVHFQDLPLLQRKLSEHFDNKSDAFEHEYRIRGWDGHYRWMAARGIAVRNAQGKPIRMAGSQSDITERKTIDALTGLPNRVLFTERAEAALRRAREYPTEGFATFYIDLDRFKIVNDSLGHLAGDQLLMQFSQRLREALGTLPAGHDLAGSLSRPPLVARLGGDEFAVMIEGLNDNDRVLKTGEQILKAMRPPFLLERQEFYTSASIGAVISAGEHLTVEDLLRDADTAMYVAKSRGRGRVALFDAAMRERTVDRVRLESDLRVALAKGQFVVFYQPRVDLTSDRICGFEALLRWRHPTRGLVQPSEFIPVAEETGMIKEIGLWVLGEACDQIRRWREAWPGLPGLDVAVNVSPVQLRDAELVGQIGAILEETGIAPSALQIEITESTIFENIESARSILLALKALGVGLKLDDFATGYSCLRHLSQLPFDSIKIDRSFTLDLGAPDSDAREMVRTIMLMAQNLSLGVIAEGVENKEGAEILRDMGCRYAQGYYFSRAVDADAIGLLLEAELQGSVDRKGPVELLVSGAEMSEAAT